MKRWAASQRGIRWTLGGIAAVGLAPAAARVLMPAGDWLAHHDVSPAREPLPQTARDAARGRLLTLGAGLLATGALVFTARRFVLSRDGQVTDRYTKAIEQLGSEKLDVRIGGIHALERVARGSARDHPAVMEMLAAFIREHSHEPWPPPDPCGQVRERSLRPDVYAAITVVGRRLTERDIRPIDLTGADLQPRPRRSHRRRPRRRQAHRREPHPRRPHRRRPHGCRPCRRGSHLRRAHRRGAHRRPVANRSASSGGLETTHWLWPTDNGRHRR